MNGEEYDWKLLSMVKGEARTKRAIKLVSDRKNWRRKSALDDEFFETSLKGKL